MTAPKELKVGDRVRVTGNEVGHTQYHFMKVGAEAEVMELHGKVYVEVMGPDEAIPNSPIYQEIMRKHLRLLPSRRS